MFSKPPYQIIFRPWLFLRFQQSFLSRCKCLETFLWKNKKTLEVNAENLIVELNNTMQGKSDIEERLGYLLPWLENKCNNFFPINKKLVSHRRKESPWLTTPLIKFINKKHSLFQLFKQGKIEHNVYSEYCCKLKQLLRICENTQEAF